MTVPSSSNSIWCCPATPASVFRSFHFPTCFTITILRTHYSYIRITCPYHFNVISCTRAFGYLSNFPCPSKGSNDSISCSIQLVTPNICPNILISATPKFLSCVFFTARSLHRASLLVLLNSCIFFLYRVTHLDTECMEEMLITVQYRVRHSYEIVIAECPTHCSSCTAHATTGVVTCSTCSNEFLLNSGKCGGKFMPPRIHLIRTIAWCRQFLLPIKLVSSSLVCVLIKCQSAWTFPCLRLQLCPDVPLLCLVV